MTDNRPSDKSPRRFVITIGRQFGSGGRELGRKIAERFGIEYYDKKLLWEAASRAGMSREIFEKNDERMPRLIGSSVGLLDGATGNSHGTTGKP